MVNNMNVMPDLGEVAVNIDFSIYKNKWLNVKYATLSSAQTLDLILPNKGKGPFPLLIIIHGGGFEFGDKVGIELETALQPAICRGIAVASLNYRLSGEAIFPAAIEDVKAAIRYLRANAKRYKLDPCRFAVWGSSSGGNLASLVGTTGHTNYFNNPTLGYPYVSSAVSAVVDWYGPINFLTMDPQFVINGIDGQNHDSPDSFESKYLGAQITRVPQLVRATNPETYLSKCCPPFLIEHGTKDANIPYQQSVLFSEAIFNFIGDQKVNLRLIDGAEHGGPLFETPENINLVFEFLQQYI